MVSVGFTQLHHPLVNTAEIFVIGFIILEQIAW